MSSSIVPSASSPCLSEIKGVVQLEEQVSHASCYPDPIQISSDVYAKFACPPYDHMGLPQVFRFPPTSHIVWVDG